jgi:FKBP-type peptidyl-prolyl cis-trans isomerase SlyD
VIIARDVVVTLDVEIWDLWKTLLESSDDPVSYLHGGYDEIFPLVEAALEGKTIGDRIDVQLEPEDGFGDYDESLIAMAPRSDFPPELAVGMQFEGLPGDEPPENDDDDAIVYTVTDIADGQVVLDGNSPFAGIAIRFVATVRAVRPATEDEIDLGAADDPTGGLFRVLH